MLECQTIIAQLVDDDQIVASSEPEAQWLPGNVLAIRRDVELSYEKLASATKHYSIDKTSSKIFDSYWERLPAKKHRH